MNGENWPLVTDVPVEFEKLGNTMILVDYACEAKPTTLKRPSPGDGFVNHMCYTKFTLA